MFKSNYKKLPNRKNNLLTREFLEDLKGNIVIRAIENDKKHEKPYYDYNNASYCSYFGNIKGTYLFDYALHDTCKKHNLIKAIYEYNKRMSWCDSDCFEGDIVGKMLDLGIIEYENESDRPIIGINEIIYILRNRYNGYDVLGFCCWDKEELEKFYSEYKNITITWDE